MKLRKYWCFLSVIAFFGACSPDDDVYNVVDYNRLGYVLADNSASFNLSKFNAAMVRTGMDKTLLGEGPFTVLVPADNVFPYTTVNDVYAESAKVLGGLVNYHVLDGNYDFDRFPFLFGQEVRTRSGKPIYVTRWVTEEDTLLMINGRLIESEPVMASNGRFIVLDKVLNTKVHDNLNNLIMDDENLSLFSHAIQRTGLSKLLSEPGAYTVFAPVNGAMVLYGYSSLKDVDNEDIGKLREMIRYHIMPERRFLNDIKLTMPVDDGIEEWGDWFFFGKNKYGIQYGHMLDGNTVSFKVSVGIEFWGEPYQGERELSMLDISNTSINFESKVDQVAGNGVLHTVGNVFKKIN